ncbi:hypothetical protein N9L68_00260 [bacterium]|nr:hypothetical protein [bacterium]
MERLLAGTPPLEGFRFLIHEAATVRPNDPLGTQVFMINDVSRAFFEAPATRNLCVEIPSDDNIVLDVRHDRVGHLRMSLYGIRDASTNWQEEVAKEMRKWGLPAAGTTHAYTSVRPGISIRSSTETTSRP